MKIKMSKLEEEWKKKLSKQQFRVLRDRITEMPFSGRFLRNKEKGFYVCAGCSNKLFSSEVKFDSGTGWPSFYNALPNAVEKVPDESHGLHRIEIICSKCKGHLGHFFEDGPNPNGRRYCVNSVSLEFKKKNSRG